VLPEDRGEQGVWIHEFHIYCGDVSMDDMANVKEKTLR
jgi:hypothetical protein